MHPRHIEPLAQAGIRTWADKGYRELGERSGCQPGPLSTLPAGKRAVHPSHARIRAVGGETNAILKSRRLLHKLHCSITRTTDIVKAVLVLQLAPSP